MQKDSFYVIGVMSGTSLDGIDICYVHINFRSHWNFEILQAETISYSKHWIKILGESIHLSQSQLEPINVAYTHYLSETIAAFIKKYRIKTLDAVCSHGHTVFHQPEKKITFQIGNLPDMASAIGYTVICDFRVQDVDLGGQGAPLVSIGDKLLFFNYDFCLNLGGFANVSFDLANKRIAYDICPLNTVLNHYVKILGFNYDDKGLIAKSGTVHKIMLKALNDLEFYKKEAPKSLGLEWVKSDIFPLIDSFNLSIQDILRTFVEHVAVQISAEINKRLDITVLVTGGGVFNSFLIEQIRHYTKHEIIIPSKEIIDYKEALIFGFLGVLKLRNEVNCLSSVTGAKMNHSSGKIFRP